jgi:hypothetical protein
MEEFLGLPRAGLEAMQLKSLRQHYENNSDKLPGGYHPVSALKVISKEASKHRIIIWGEEHHLSQSRAIYSAILRELWKKGFRYLAAETFSPDIESANTSYVTYNDGYYLQDVVFADAVRTAKKLGFKLIAYDNKEKERDKRQAELIKEKIFDKDPNAKVFIIAGRGHISEKISSDGWEPMGYCLEKLTGLDAFTIYAPTMSERISPDEEHPAYRDADKQNLLKEICIFVNEKKGSYYGTESMDAYVFFPRVKYISGRPDWLFNILGRKPVTVPKELITSATPLLIQAFPGNDPAKSIPADQVLITAAGDPPSLALEPGIYWLRSIERNGNSSAVLRIRVGNSGKTTKAGDLSAN